MDRSAGTRRAFDEAILWQRVIQSLVDTKHAARDGSARPRVDSIQQTHPSEFGNRSQTLGQRYFAIKKKTGMRKSLHPIACESPTRLVLCRRSVLAIGLLGCLVILFGGCERDSSTPAAVELRGAGSIFPEPLYDRWFRHMTEQHPELAIDYEKIGSGAGVQQFVDELVDFAASDDPLTDGEVARVDRGVRQVPMTSGAIVLAYNLHDSEGNPVTDLRLSRKAYAGMFLGTIRTWLDEEIAKHNPDVVFPDLPIQVEYRLDSSGTTSALTRHLSEISQDWKQGPGIGKTVIWPVGAGMPKDRGVARGLRQVPGSIGYLSYGFAKQEKLPMAILENKAGSFVAPDSDSIQLGLSEIGGTISEESAFVVDPVGEGAYPIVTYSWILCYRVYEDPDKLAMLKSLISYGLQEGQQFSRELGYVALSDGVSQDSLTTLESITLPQSADTATSIRVPGTDTPSGGIAVGKGGDEAAAAKKKVPPEKPDDVEDDDVSAKDAAADDKEPDAARPEQPKTGGTTDEVDQSPRSSNQ
jgi:phosphate transport system substrate-binding protein